MGNLNSACSFGLLCVSPSLMQTVAETPSSRILAPQPPPSGPKLPMKHPPGRHNGLEAAERSVIDGIVPGRGDALVGDLGTGMPRGDPGVVEAAHLLGDLAEIDGHLVALHGDTDPDRHRLAELDAVVVHVGFGFVDAVGNGARAPACHRL